MITYINISRESKDVWNVKVGFDERHPYTGTYDGYTLEEMPAKVGEIIAEYRENGLKADPLEEAKDAIIKYCMDEFGLMFKEDVDVSDLSRIAIGYTTTGDGDHDIQWYADLKKVRLFAEIDGKEACTEEYPSLLEMARVFREEDSDYIFADLVGMAEEWIEEAQHEG